jgi:transglutaminase-like putative cysteine protease
MPTYRIHHLTRYSYDEPVSVCHNLAHLLPREGAARHAWRYSDLEISPAPAVRAERRDYFGNRLTFFAIQEPHRELEVITRAQVDLEPAGENYSCESPAWEMVRDRLAGEKVGAGGAELLDAFQFTFASPCIRWTEEVERYAAQSFAPGRPVLEGVLELNARIHREFTYDKQCTTTSTTLPEVMEKRAGVCQDFAHLMIGGLRSQGLAARYVSGYLLTAPPPGKPRLIGSDASHAWLSVYVPGFDGMRGGGGRWVDVDPTNNAVVGEKHITLAWGRDFGDVSPLRGVILGGGRHRVAVSVDVSPV